MKGMLLRGLQKGLLTTWVLGKVIAPITILVSLLKHTPVIEWIVQGFSPVMGLFGLPGEAAVVLVLGWVLNLYAAIGAIFSLQLGVQDIFVLAVMLSFAHNLFVETAVAGRIGIRGSVVAAIRLVSVFAAGAALHLVMGNHSGAVGGAYQHLSYLWEVPWTQTAWEVLTTMVNAIWSLAMVVIPLMVVIQVLKEYRFLDYIARFLLPFLRWLGLPEKAAIPLLAGIWFGLAFGAGVIIDATQENPMSKRDTYLIMVFLIFCHAVVEDTLIFLPLGINGWYLLGTRLLTAIVVTALVSRVWRTKGIGEANMAIKYILFDLDGTLIDTNELILRSFEHTLGHYAPGKYTREHILPKMGEPLWDQMEHFVPGRAPEMVETYRDYNVAQHDTYVTEFPHVREVLERLHADGYKMAVVTSKMRLTAQMGWELCKLTPYMDAFVCMEDTENHKPHPDPVLLGMQLLDANPDETMMVGDSPYDILAGQAAGTTTVGVKWSLRGEAGLRPYDPDFLVADMLELEAIIRDGKVRQ